MAVPFLDVTAQYRTLQAEIEQALIEVARSGHYILGERGASLEKELAAYAGVRHAVGCASGTDALILALRASGVGPGHEVITTTYSFFATASCISLVGATPVFVDIDPRTYNLDWRQVERKVTVRTKAVIPVHLYGQPAEMEPLLALAKEWGIRVIEDACQSIGAEYKGKRACSLGDIGCVSFYPTKNLSGMGDGGMAFTNDPELAENLRILREHGAKPRYVHKTVGYNSRLDELQAAVLLVKAPHLEEWTADAFGVPNRHMVFSDRPLGDGFKFDDYYSAYGVEHIFTDLRQQAAPSFSEVVSGCPVTPEMVETKKRAMLAAFPPALI